MQMTYWRRELLLANAWCIASNMATGGKTTYPVVFLELVHPDGRHGRGESAPSSRYQESAETVLAFLQQVEARQLSFDDIPASMAYLDSLSQENQAAKTAINLALWDGAARAAGQRLCDYLGLGFTEQKHLTSFSIGIASPAKIAEKVAAAADFPILKLKLGSPQDRENLAALRAVAPRKPLFVDANEAWRTKEEALKNLEWLAQDSRIQIVEQPMPSGAPMEDARWLKERSPLPLVADESCRGPSDVPRCVEGFHGVNVKLVKTAGISGALATLQAARKAGLKTMLGCMIESSLLISAAAHLAELTDYLDLDGNLLITNDPGRGVTATSGILSLAGTPEPLGLCVHFKTWPSAS